MTVTYGNSGDTDALGVPIFVTIPSGVTVQVLTDLLVPPDSDPLLMSTVPQTVTIGNNTVLPLFIPRIAAGTSGSVQIQVTPPSTDTDITLTAYNWEPLATSASDLETDLGTYQNGNLDPMLRSSRRSLARSLASDAYTLVLDPVAGSKCFQDVILLSLQVATNVNPVAPGLKCTSSMVSFLGSAVTTLINSELSSNYSSSDAASDLGQLYAGGAQAALNCVQTAAGSTPAGMAVNIIATLLQNAIPIANTLSDCSQVATINNNSAKNSTVGGAIDPNDKSGPIGDGSANQYIRKQGLTYNLAFENDPTATLPAAQVVITDQLDPTKVNLNTFSLGLISFGGNTISVPSGTTSFSTLYSLNSSLSVQIQASLNMTTGLATWTFTSIDPSTGLPPTDPTVGFLPPDVNGIEGQGSVLFNVMPISSLATGTQIANTASVVFDSNSAISTPTWLNTIDITPPVSSVTALPATEVSSGGQAIFNVSWLGTDVGSGVANYTIYVSVNGGAFTPWLIDTTSTTAAYTGAVGNTYGFYSIAKDGAGNIETSKTAAEATTQVVIAPTTAVVSAWPTATSITYGQTLASSTLNGGTASVSGSFAFTTPSTAPGAGTALQSVTFTPTDTTDYNNVTGSVSVTVNQATPTVTWPTATAITYGQTLASSTLNGGTASVSGSFAFTTPSTAPGVGTAKQGVTFTPADTTDYNNVTGSVSVTVSKATPTVTWPTATAITYGQTLASSTLSGGSAISPITSAAVAGSFKFTTPTTAPTAGTHSESVTFTPNDTTDYSTVTNTVSVQVNQATPTVKWPTASAIDYGQTLASSTLSGGSAISPITSAAVAGTFAFTYPATAPSATASQSVTFTPSDTADYKTVTGTVTVTLIPVPLAAISASNINFGTIYLGSIVTKTITVTNVGDAPMIVNQPFISNVQGGNFTEFIAENLCPPPLAVGKSCTISITFIAGPFFNPQTATLSINDNAPGSPQKVSLTALVIDPLAHLSISSWNFGTQKENTSSGAEVVTLTNTGLTALTINNIAIAGADPLDFTQTNTCPSTLAANSSCKINVTFKPTAKGLRSASVVITDNAQSSPQSISLIGAGN
jgi:hypothetical protein